jgi:hypothetical protein
MRIIVLHDIFSNEPIVVKTSAINAVQKIDDGEKEWSGIFVGNFTFDVAESFDTIMQKIREVESEK